MRGASAANGAAGTQRARAPYHLNLDTGRKLQFLGPIVENGAYELELAYGLAHQKPLTTSGRFVLDRRCPPTG